MPRDGAIIFADLIGKLDVLRVACKKCGRELPRDFIDRIFGWLRGYTLGECTETFFISGLIIFNFVLLALTAAAGLFAVDVVFALTLLMLAATAALVSIDRQ